MLARAPEQVKNTILIAHKPNIVDALGKDWFDVKEGEASIFKPEDSKYRLVRACKWRTGRSSLPSSRGALTEAARISVTGCYGGIRLRNNVSEPLNRACAGCVLAKRKVPPHLIIVARVFRKNAPKMFFVEHDHVVRALMPSRTD